MDVDLEVGGNDQTFNMLAGRELTKQMRNKEKFVLATKLLTDPSGKKMGKSEGNLIPLDEKPGEIYGKIMSWPDSLLETGFELLTNIPLDGAKELLKNPRQAKVKLAKEIVAVCYSESAANTVEKEFEKVFKNKELPTNIPEAEIKGELLNILDLLVKTKLASSKSEAKRLILQGGVKIDGQAQADWQETVKIKKGLLVRVGKRKFAKIA